MDITGYIVLGNIGIGAIALFALAYEMVRNSNDVKKVIDALKVENKSLEIKVRKPDLVKLNRLIKISYRIMKSPQHKQESKEHFPELIQEMITLKKTLTDLDWLQAERNNMHALTHLHNDSIERLKGVLEYYKQH